VGWRWWRCSSQEATTLGAVATRGASTPKSGRVTARAMVLFLHVVWMAVVMIRTHGSEVDAIGRTTTSLLAVLTATREVQYGLILRSNVLLVSKGRSK
uniref:Uncharacterized protein n=1 Tax=Oryza glaberrima TaxID=4538 RepID=I1Q496_ORYGL